jgi:uncharacterized protein YciI
MFDTLMRATVALSLVLAMPNVVRADGGSPKPTAAKTLQFVYVLHVSPSHHDQANWSEADRAAVGAHFKRLQNATAAGQVILAGKTDEPLDRTFGLVVFEASDASAAETFMKEDPAVIAGVMTAELHPYAVALLRQSTAK